MAKGEWKETTKLVNAALTVLEQENPMTVRQLFYRLVSASVISNNRCDYQKVSRVMTKARDDGRCDWDWIVDRSRPIYAPSVWRDPAGYAEIIKTSYRRDFWAMQPHHVEIWTEKDAISGAVQPVTDKWGVKLRVYRGFNSTTGVRDIAEDMRRCGKPTFCYYLGDHDPSGCCIEEEGVNRLREKYSGDFSLERLAIHQQDIRKFSLPPLRVKDTDSRSRKFRAKYGEECVELDALPPTELRRRVEQAITKHIRWEAWNRAITMEDAELESIRDFADKWQEMLATRPGGR